MCEFEVQFVNPDKKFYAWGFDKFSNPALLTKYIEDGVFNESFELEGADPGIWEVTIKNLGATDPVNPVYIKYTVFTNYATPNETSVTRSVNLSQIPAKSILDSFTN